MCCDVTWFIIVATPGGEGPARVADGRRVGHDIDSLRIIEYSLSSDQEAVRDALGEFFRNECPTERVRASEPLGYDQKLWWQLADMGAASMGLTESTEGGGASLVDLVLVAEEAGAALAPVPFVRISDRYRLGGVNDGWSVLHRSHRPCRVRASFRPGHRDIRRDRGGLPRHHRPACPRAAAAELPRLEDAGGPEAGRPQPRARASARCHGPAPGTRVGCVGPKPRLAGCVRHEPQTATGTARRRRC